MIAPYGGNRLVLSTSSRRSDATRRILAGDTPCRITQDGDDGVNAVFDAEDSRFFLKLMGAIRR